MKLSDYDRPKGRYLFYAVKNGGPHPSLFFVRKIPEGKRIPYIFFGSRKEEGF